MPSVRINTRIDDRRIRHALERLQARAARLRPAFLEIGEHLLQTTEERFRTERAPDGSPWAPLHPATRARKRHPKILTERGRLRGSIVYRASDKRVEIGTNVLYAAIHQLGGRTRPHPIRPRRKKALAWPGARHPVRGVQHPGSLIPARPYLGLSAADRREVVRIIHDHLRRALD